MSNNLSRRENLVVVRAGASSLHRKWLADSESRTWDMVVSRYDEGGSRRHEGTDIYEMFVPGGKWNGLYETIINLPRGIHTYRYVWLPDDDIETDSNTIDAMFDRMSCYNLLIGQPALDWSSFYTYPHTLRCAAVELRYTDLVELMIPCFESRHLSMLLPEFRDTATGWGLDWVWCRSAEQNERRFAIIDSCAMRHTRPVGLHLYKHAEGVGENASERMEAFLEKYPEVSQSFKPSCYRAVGFGNKLYGRQTTAIILAFSFASYMRTVRKLPLFNAVAEGISLYRTQRKPDFSTLSLDRQQPTPAKRR